MSAGETSVDKYIRVCSMILDDGSTWDLSTNDKEALRHVLGILASVSDELAKYEGSTVPCVMKKYGERNQ